LLEISGSHSIFIGDSYILHYGTGNKIVSRTGNKKIRHFLTTINVQKNPLAPNGRLSQLLLLIDIYVIICIYVCLYMYMYTYGYTYL